MKVLNRSNAVTSTTALYTEGTVKLLVLYLFKTIFFMGYLNKYRCRPQDLATFT